MSVQDFVGYDVKCPDCGERISGAWSCFDGPREGGHYSPRELMEKAKLSRITFSVSHKCDGKHRVVFVTLATQIEPYLDKIKVV